MNRFLIPVTATALAAGVAIPGFFGRRTIERVVTEPVETVVREVYHETPVVYVDTVYMAADPEPVQPVYVQNEYNEYNHTDVYVRKEVVVPPPRPVPRWSPREPERRQGDRRRDGESGRDRNKPGDSDRPGPVNPKRPVKKMDVPAPNDRQPVPPLRPAPPKRQVPVGSAQVTQVQPVTPKQVPVPVVDKPVTPTSDQVQISLAKPVRK